MDATARSISSSLARFVLAGLFGLWLTILLIGNTQVLAGGLREAGGHVHGRVLEDGTVIQRCAENTLKTERDPNAEFRRLPGSMMKSIPFESTVYIPVVFHICRRVNATLGNVPVSSIQKALANMNQAYGGMEYNGGRLDSNIRFFLQGIIYWDNTDYFMSCEGLDSSMKNSTAVKQESVLNIWTCRLPDFLGYSFFPWTDVLNHGVVVNFQSFPPPSSSKEDPYYVPFQAYQLGYTLVHEVGHSFGLVHTFEGGCTGTDAADTAPEAQPYYGSCDSLNPDLVAPDTCAGGGKDPINNFMDYSEDSCMRVFSQGQIDRMHAELTKYKPAMAYMAHSLTCYADGAVGTANRYAVCTETFPSMTTMPNGEPAPSNGWCYAMGFPSGKWGTACCPGSCADFDTIASSFPPLGTSNAVPTASPTSAPPVVAYIDPVACNKPVTWAVATAACRKRKMRLCTSKELKLDALLADAVTKAPNCASLQSRILWTSDACPKKLAISSGASAVRDLCEKKTKKYPYACCQGGALKG